ncbi:thioredoxin family protein [Roseomonas sp. BN140053]|uniref:thioredoxin family protein n=1 Tax=Roseomonas sp. BN140053 TaxID=3391898 RepID=UPI0039E80887
MAETRHPEFFQHFPMRAVLDAELDAVLAEPGAERLSVLFLWGRDCPNCDLAKAAMLIRPERFRWPAVRWLHDNVYGDPEMATRFGLHGIPVFLVFRDGRLRGRITGWPGAEAFVAALGKQIAEAG